jgi:uncharacterized repeat protein (TIGR03806 family)
VHYSSSKNELVSTISRFTVSGQNPNIADKDSEEIVLELKQPYRNHNGGAIAFGGDGYLYISFGDGGKANDPHRHGQNLKTLFGSILRIDVDRKTDSLNYAIPDDNPFVDSAEGMIEARPEIWAYGLRNVWKFSFDRETDELWAGDVGQGKFEAVYKIEKGGNYGWNRFEAGKPFDAETELAQPETTPPVALYSHKWGLSITGGNVYRGRRYPQLDGKYFYADYISGNLWSVSPDESGQLRSKLERRTGRSVASFGEDENGEVYICSFDGYIYRIVATDEPDSTLASWPQKLSETGIFASMQDQKISDDYVHYEVNAPFWSDGATKHRYFKLPEGEQLGYRADGTWEIPVGGRIVKHFETFNKVPIETRLIVRAEHAWEAATYVWNRSSDEATLMPEGYQQERRHPVFDSNDWKQTVWLAPSSSECASCHTDAAGYVLGMNTAQLNRTPDGETENQIQKWIASDLVDIEEFDPEDAARFCSPFDDSVDVETRARVLLDVNCAMCHRPNGPGNSNIDLRCPTALEATGLMGVRPAQTDLGIADAKIIDPGRPDNSILLHRMNTLGQGRMPTIGSAIVDAKGTALIRQWIESLGSE